MIIRKSCGQRFKTLILPCTVKMWRSDVKTIFPQSWICMLGNTVLKWNILVVLVGLSWKRMETCYSEETYRGYISLVIPWGTTAENLRLTKWVSFWSTTELQSRWGIDWHRTSICYREWSQPLDIIKVGNLQNYK